MKVSRECQEMLEQLRHGVSMLITATYEEEDIEDLGKVYRIGEWVRTEPHLGYVCCVMTDGTIIGLQGPLQIDSFVRHISKQPDEVNKELTVELITLIDYAEPYAVGPDPENDGRTLLGVKIETHPDQNIKHGKAIEEWFGTVSVNTRLLKIHLRDAGYIAWWLSHSPSTKTLNK